MASTIQVGVVNFIGSSRTGVRVIPVTNKPYLIYIVWAFTKSY
jgi:hypothetical protein